MDKSNTRIIAGTKRGLLLDNPQKGTRPLTDRLKTSLFDLIRDFVPEAKILDLYAGGGNFGIEALSRGASSATFVDIANSAIKAVEKNLEKAEFTDRAELNQSNVQDFVREDEENFDVIFADPPFENIIIEHIQDASKLLAKNGLFVFKHPNTFEGPEKIGQLKRTYTKIYGMNQLSFYQNA